jgi:ankyrin repeat protein
MNFDAADDALPAPPEWDRLLSACQKNDATLVRKLMEQEGVPASHANRVGQSALHIATLWGHGTCLYGLVSVLGMIEQLHVCLTLLLLLSCALT